MSRRLAAAIVVLAVLPGCGGSPAPSPPSPAQRFRAALDRHCRLAQAQVRALPAATSSLDLARKAVALDVASLARLRATRAPAGLRAQFAAYVAADAQAVALGRGLIAVNERHDAGGMQALEARLAALGATARSAARRLGLRDCAKAAGAG